MGKNTLSITLASTLFFITSAQASEFDGGYVGGKIGYNDNSPTTSSTENKAYPGFSAGYGWDIYALMVGVDAFWDGHTKSVTDKDYGADVKIGLPLDRFMPYAKIGAADSVPGTRVHGGLGIEYKFAPQWSVMGEVTADSKTVNAVKFKNNNIAFGINYYFDKPVVAPAIVAAVAPVIIKQPEPVVIPEPAPAPPPVVVEPPPAPKVVFTDRPITIEGASFDYRSAKLKPTAFSKLDEVVEFSKKYSTAALTVVGYTDSRGSDAINQKLSLERAESVKAYLMQKGVDANRIVTTGKGAADPIGDNKTEAGRTLNRRVEIKSVERVAK